MTPRPFSMKAQNTMGNATANAVSSLSTSTMRRDVPLGLAQAIATGNKNAAQYVRDVNMKRQDIDLRSRFAPRAATTNASIDTINTTPGNVEQNPVAAKYSKGASPVDELSIARASGSPASSVATARAPQGSYASRLLGG